MNQKFLLAKLCTAITLLILVGACQGKNLNDAPDASIADSGDGSGGSDCVPIGITETGRSGDLEGCFEADGTVVYFSSKRENNTDVTCGHGPTHPATVTARYWTDAGNEVVVTLEDGCLADNDIAPADGPDADLVPSNIFAATHVVNIQFNEHTVGSSLPDSEVRWDAIKALFHSPIGQAIQRVPMELALEDTSQESPGELAALVAPWQFGLRNPAQSELEQARIAASAASGNFFAPDLFAEGVISVPWWRRPTDLIFSEALPFPHVFGYLPFEPPPYIAPPQAFRSPDGAQFSVGTGDVCNESLDACSGACGQGCYSDSCKGQPKCSADSPLFSQGDAVGIQWECETDSTCQELDSALNACASSYSDCTSWGRAACFVRAELTCLNSQSTEACLSAFFGDFEKNLEETVVFLQVSSDQNDLPTVPTPESGLTDNLVDCLDDEGDQDSDGLPNLKEILSDSDPFNPDTDGDGFLDGSDACPTVPGDGPNGCGAIQILSCEETCNESDGLSSCLNGELCSCIGDFQASSCPDETQCLSLAVNDQFGAWCGNEQSKECADACSNDELGFPEVCLDENILCTCTPDFGRIDCKEELDQKCVSYENDGPQCGQIPDSTEGSPCSQLCDANGQKDSCIDQLGLCMCTGESDLASYDCSESGDHNICVPSDTGGEAICAPNPGLTTKPTCTYLCAGLSDDSCLMEDPTYLCLCSEDPPDSAIDCSQSSFTDTCMNDATGLGQCGSWATTPETEFSQSCVEICEFNPPGQTNCNYTDANQLCLCDGAGTAKNCDFQNPGWVCNGIECGPPSPDSSPTPGSPDSP